MSLGTAPLSRRAELLPWVGTLGRLVVGGVWIWAGALKVGDPAASVTAVRAYQLLPAGLAEAVGRVLPMLELVVGVCLVLGLLTRGVAVLSVVLQVAFIVGIASVWARGIAIDCGCFGDGGPDPDAFDRYPWEIARDVGLMLLSLLLVRLRRTPSRGGASARARWRSSRRWSSSWWRWSRAASCWVAATTPGPPGAPRRRRWPAERRWSSATTRPRP